MEPRSVLVCVLIVMLYFPSPVMSGNASILCPRLVSIEMGQQSRISCNTTGDSAFDVYWYRGSPLNTSPILRLENGKQGGLEHKTKHYNISKNGDMIIKNATVNQESVYTVAAFFEDGTIDHANVTVKIIVTPYPRCPQVNDCMSCTDCNFNVSGSPVGILRCSITDSRPKIDIEWIIKSQKGVSFVMQLPTFTHKEETYSWTTVADVSYEAYLCGETASLECISRDDYGLLSRSVTEVRIYTDECIEDTSSGTSALVFVIVAIVVILSVSFCLFVYCKKKGHSHHAIRVERPEDSKELPLAAHLRNCYKRECTLQELPSGWREPIPVEQLFTGFPCQLKYNTTETENVSCDQLFKGDYIKNKQRVLITGFGKTTLMKQFTHLWIQDDQNDFELLIFISVKGVKVDMNVAEFVKGKLSDCNEVTTADISTALKERKCLILLDGLQYLSSNTSSPEDSSTVDGFDGNDVTIENILNDKITTQYKNIYVWATSTEPLHSENPFLNIIVQIKLYGFSDDQWETLVRKTSLCYATFHTECEEIETNEVVKASQNVEAGATNHVRGQNNISARDKDQSECGLENKSEESVPMLHVKTEGQTRASSIGDERVYSFLTNNDIINEFKTVQHILILIIHIASAKFTGKVPQLKDVCITNITQLIKCVIKILLTRGIRQYSQKEITTLYEKLGNIAFKSLFPEDALGDENPSLSLEDYIKTGKITGILTKIQVNNSHSLTGKNENGGLTFCHNYIRWYFVVHNTIKNPNKIEKLTQKMKTHKGGDILGTLKFSSLLDKESFENLCEILFSCGLHNSVIDCVHDRGNNDDCANIIRKFSQRRIIISRTTRNHQQEAVKTLCKICCQKQITLKEISFHGKWSLQFLQSLDFPKVEILEFSKGNIHETEVIPYFQWLSKICVGRKVRFLRCKIARQFAVETRDEIKKLVGTSLHVERVDESSDSKEMLHAVLNFKSAEWKLT